MLKSMAKARGLSNRDLAGIAQVSHDTANRWLKGEVYPRADELARLADYFGVTMDELCARPPAPNVVSDDREQGLLRQIRLLGPDEAERRLLGVGREESRLVALIRAMEVDPLEVEKMVWRLKPPANQVVPDPESAEAVRQQVAARQGLPAPPGKPRGNAG